jgi:hypothetical protein
MDAYSSWHFRCTKGCNYQQRALGAKQAIKRTLFHEADTTYVSFPGCFRLEFGLYVPLQGRKSLVVKM